MTALNFPASPTLNQTYTANGRTYQWNGTVWNAVAGTVSSGFSGATTGSESGSALTLTASSSQYQIYKPTSYANAIINLPNATTCTKGFAPFVIDIRSPIGANVLIKNASGTIIGGVPSGAIATIALTDNSTSAGVWTISQTTWQNDVVGFDNASVTSATNTPNLVGYSGGNSYGVVGLTSTTFVRWWVVGVGGTTGGSQLWMYLYTQAGTISGSTITLGSIQNTQLSYTSTAGGGISPGFISNVNAHVVRLSATSFVALLGINGYTANSFCSCGAPYTFYTPRTYNFVGVCSVSGTTVTYGTFNSSALPFNTSTADNTNQSISLTAAAARLSDTSFAVVYNDAATNSYSFPYNYSGSIACTVFSVSGTTITPGTKVQLATSTYSQVQSIVPLSSSSLFVCYVQAASAGSNLGRTKMNVISVSGTVPTFGTSVTIESADTTVFYNGAPVLDGGVAPSSSQAVFNAGYFVGVASISGTTPTYTIGPYQNGRLGSMYLTTSSRAIMTNSSYSYMDISANGFTLYTTKASTNQLNSGIANTYLANPLGATPTTSYIFTDYGPAISKLILGASS